MMSLHLLRGSCQKKRSFIGGLNIGGERVLGLLLLRASERSASVVVVATGLVELHELRDVKLRLLQNLHFADHAILQRVDRLGLLLNLLADGLRNELLNELAQLKDCMIRKLR